MTTIVKIILLLLSLTGYAALYHRRRLPACYFPVTLVSGISVAMYAFGMLGGLKIGSYAILLLGLLSLVLCRGFKGWREFLSDGSILFTVFAACWLYVITRGTMLAHWDDGSHWYRITKALNYEHAFPTTPDILYNEYVPGCQVFIYFLMRFIDFTIPNALFAHNLVNVACVTTLFAALDQVKERAHRLAAVAVIGVSGITLCSMTVSTYVLMVDLPLGLVAMSALIMVLDRGEQRNAFVPLTLMLTFLALIKNSGILFVAIIAVWAFVMHRYPPRALAARAAGWIALPAAALIAYVARAKILFGGSELTQQKLSLERMMGMLADKDAATLWQFTRNFLERVFIGDTDISLAVYMTILLLVFLWLSVKREGRLEKADEIRRCLLGGLAMLGVYLVSLYLTYLLTMRVDEALSVNSFYRYFGTGAIIFAGAGIFVALRSAATANASVRTYIMAMLLFAVVAMPGVCSKRYILGQEHYSFRTTYHEAVWNGMKIAIPENQFYTEDSYVVLFNQNGFGGPYVSSGRLEYAVGAWVRSGDVTVISKNDILEGLKPEAIAALTESDYLVLLSDMTDQAEQLSQYVDLTEFALGTYKLDGGRAQAIWQAP